MQYYYKISKCTILNEIKCCFVIFSSTYIHFFGIMQKIVLGGSDEIFYSKKPSGYEIINKNSLLPNLGRHSSFPVYTFSLLDCSYVEGMQFYFIRSSSPFLYNIIWFVRMVERVQLPSFYDDRNKIYCKFTTKWNVT
jgi:hypothetical protein